jgi:hypothetical protein
MHMLTTLQDQTSGVLHGNPKEATYKETVKDLENQFGDHHLAIGFCSQLRTMTSCRSMPLQTHYAFSALHKDHIPKGSDNAFSNTIRD